MLKANILHDIEKRFEEELIQSISELKDQLLLKLQYRKTNLQNLKKLKINKLLKRDILQQTIAQTLEQRDIVISPYELLRDEILSQQDIIKKYSNLSLFIQQYCRIANDEEDGNWFYCIDSNIKLLPTFYEKLIEGFNNDRYMLTLEEIYRERGEKSDDGDKWVDKYSGFYISGDIALDFSEGYNKDGYKIKSREIMEEDAADKLRKNRIMDTTRTYSTTLNLLDNRNY